ncbi:hypothetical protein SAMN05216559_1115 [Halomicrobium zhouii]|uniref:DUF8151 domain-containing protein n=1 Tax=Halomicrobium zhouii TaxID=767519 RepID=A0A1I6KN70_9EURY|nr:hypothetical protein [Halomicrobium zhouii]SFR92631.1 hypothetical protein SAMN05216559_1115 [Halomicrobium zhouii]
MPELSPESLVELFTVAVELVAMVLLSTLGLLAERAGFAALASGFEPVSLWLVGVGAVALYAGVYMIGYQRLLGRVLTTAA